MHVGCVLEEVATDTTRPACVAAPYGVDAKFCESALPLELRGLPPLAAYSAIQKTKLGRARETKMFLGGLARFAEIPLLVELLASAAREQLRRSLLEARVAKLVVEVEVRGGDPSVAGAFALAL